MGHIYINKLSDYWKTDQKYNLKLFSSRMSRDGFLRIIRTLHFVTNPNEGKPLPLDPLYKIRPLIDYIKKNMAEIVIAGKDLPIDESMLLWIGQLSFQKGPKKKKKKAQICLKVIQASRAIRTYY